MYTIYEELSLELDRLLQENKKLKAEKSENSKGMTAAQQAKFFRLIYEERGTFEEMQKNKLANFIAALGGKNRRNIEDRLKYNFENLQDRRDFRVLLPYLWFIEPEIALKVENSLAPYDDQQEKE